MRTLMIVLALAALTEAVSAQERRRSAGPPDATTLQYQAGNPRYPFSGSWVGSMTRTGVGSFPIGVNIVADQGRHEGVSSIAAGQFSPHRNAVVEDKIYRWEEESGAGVLQYSARLVGKDSLSGTVTLKGAAKGAANAAQGTFVLVRSKPPAQVPEQPGRHD